MDHPYTIDDAVTAAEALREISAGHEQAATALLDAAGLSALSNDELEDLRARFGVEALPVRAPGCGQRGQSRPRSSDTRNGRTSPRA